MPAAAVRVIDVTMLPPADAVTAWRRWLRPREIDTVRERRRSLLHLAARLMAKRASLALLDWPFAGGELDIEVVGLGTDRPRLLLDGPVAAWAERAGCASIDVSMSHTERAAGALAIAARDGTRICGFDLLDVPRWELAVRRSGVALLNQITAHGEDLHGHSGTRFALKECVIKAIGGLPADGRFADIAVTFDGRHRPRITTRGAVAARLGRQGWSIVAAATAAPSPQLVSAGVVLAAKKP